MATKKITQGQPNAGSLVQLSKREYFAGFALAGLLARGTVDQEAPKLAVAAADLLVAALNGRAS